MSAFCCFFAAEAQIGTHLNFDAVNDYVVRNTSPITQTYTKEAMVRLNSAGGNQDVVSGNENSQEALWFIDGKLAAGHNGAGGGSWTYCLDTETIVANVWYHIAVTYDAATTTMKLYKNGLLISTNTNVPPAPKTSGSKFYVGCYGGFATYFNGNIDEVRLWDRVLTQEELQNNSSCELLSGQTGLLLYYKFNQGVNNSNNAGITSATDSSGNNYTGTLTNFSLTGTTSNWASGSPVSSDCQLGSSSPIEATISVYPNPVKDYLTINNVTNDTAYTIYDISGRLAGKGTVAKGNATVNLSAFTSGLYLVSLESDGKISVVKIVKE